MRGPGPSQDVEVTRAPNGRPEVEVDGRVLDTGDRRGADALLRRTGTEIRAIARLGALVNDCLAGRHAPPVEPADDLSWIPSSVRGAPDLRAVTACRSTGRRVQLDPYAAPPALLFATAPDRETATFFDLSGGNRVRGAGVTVAVLLTTMAVTFVAGTRMVCPLRAADLEPHYGDYRAYVKCLNRNGLKGSALPDNSGWTYDGNSTMSQARQNEADIGGCLQPQVEGEAGVELPRAFGIVRSVRPAGRSGLDRFGHVLKTYALGKLAESRVPYCRLGGFRTQPLVHDRAPLRRSWTASCSSPRRHLSMPSPVSPVKPVTPSGAPRGLRPTGGPYARAAGRIHHRHAWVNLRPPITPSPRLDPEE
ncbi:hypothetical protein AQI94_29155 [Streptomyces pseudovenezuelae]|uniref:Uncharacterized protein n=1 Tax=Streptomyces pseudovenezuelae TaxID=67350 RepID=A0A101N163_9ACTN|nr:hypothetical protein AQI94_29155 [Streptomyces pseudovenezuelae]